MMALNGSDGRHNVPYRDILCECAVTPELRRRRGSNAQHQTNNATDDGEAQIHNNYISPESNVNREKQSPESRSIVQHAKKLWNQFWIGRALRNPVGSRRSINSLDDDSLLEIFSHLPIDDMLQAQKVCRRWNVLLEESWKTIVGVAYIRNFLHFYRIRAEQLCGVVKVENIHIILNHCGDFIRFLYLYPCDHHVISSTEIAQIITSRCKNIKNLHITLPDIPMIRDFRIRAVSYCTNLETLDIHNFLSQMESDLILVLKRNKNLCRIHLLVSKDSSITGRLLKFIPSKIEGIEIENVDTLRKPHFVVSELKRFDKLEIFLCNHGEWFTDEMATILFGKTTLTQLSIQFSWLVPSSYELMSKLVNLTELYVGHNANFLDDSLITISNNCKQLETLDATGCVFLTNRGIISLSNLNNLTFLFIPDIDNVTDEPFEYLPKTLKTFSCRGCHRVADTGLMKLLIKAKNLQRLMVQNCPKVTNMIISTAIMVKQPVNSTDNILHLHIRETSINMDGMWDKVPPSLKIYHRCVR